MRLNSAVNSAMELKKATSSNVFWSPPYCLHNCATSCNRAECRDRSCGAVPFSSPALKARDPPSQSRQLFVRVLRGLVMHWRHSIETTTSSPLAPPHALANTSLHHGRKGGSRAWKGALHCVEPFGGGISPVAISRWCTPRTTTPSSCHRCVGPECWAYPPGRATWHLCCSFQLYWTQPVAGLCSTSGATPNEFGAVDLMGITPQQCNGILARRPHNSCKLDIHKVGTKSK